jgi:hypothetical protein
MFWAFGLASDPDNNLRGPRNFVLNGKRNDAIGADNLIDGYDNFIRGNQNFAGGDN